MVVLEMDDTDLENMCRFTKAAIVQLVAIFRSHGILPCESVIATGKDGPVEIHTGALDKRYARLQQVVH